MVTPHASAPLRQPLILVGFMGAGKSLIGPLVADQLRGAFYDLDAIITEQHGPISAWFSTHGEASFRDIECHALRTVIANASTGAVIATGGGVVTHEPSCELLRNGPFVVWLRVGLATVQERLAHDTTPRPLADAQLTDRFYARQSMYQTLAHAVVDVDDASPKEIAEMIVNRYR